MEKNYKSSMRRYKEGRDREIVLTASIGVVASLFLSFFIISSGILTHSFTMILDGIETISTAIDSIVVIVGIKLSQKEPDSKHPLGYGRMEYLSDMVVSFLIIYVGITAGYAEIQSIKNAVVPTYDSFSMLILGISFMVKFMLAFHERRIGFKVHSRALLGASIDSFAIAFVSLSIMVSAYVYRTYGLNIEAYIGMIIAFLIIRSGFAILKATCSELLGTSVNSKLVQKIKNAVLDFEGVEGVHDLTLHSYGRYRYLGSVHIDVLSSIGVLELEELQRQISEKIYVDYGVSIHAVGIYVIDVHDGEYMDVYYFVHRLAFECDDVESVHGIYVDKKKGEIMFDMVICSSVEDKDQVVSNFKKVVAERYDGCEVFIHKDIPLD